MASNNPLFLSLVPAAATHQQDDGANAELVPKFHVALHASHAALPMVALEISHCTNVIRNTGTWPSRLVESQMRQ
jgi:hypothetical protein